MILLIGFIMVAFTERKQGLHDIIASTLVVKGKPGEVGFDPGRVCLSHCNLRGRLPEPKAPAAPAPV